MKRSHLYLYCSHALSAWGDRMWMFAVGLFLVELSPGSLRLTASYGGASGGAILILGALVGDWVDANPRLKVARTSIAIQNVTLCISAATTALVVIYRSDLDDIWRGLEPLCLTIIITTAVIADVGSVARQISIERDWIVVMCPDEHQLTAMSAFLRRIDLCMNILAPVATGQIITFTSTSTGALVIAGWNLVSLAVEYGMLYMIYISVPELQYKTPRIKQPNKPDEDKVALIESGSTHKQDYGSVRTIEEANVDPENLTRSRAESPSGDEHRTSLVVSYSSDTTKEQIKLSKSTETSLKDQSDVTSQPVLDISIEKNMGVIRKDSKSDSLIAPVASPRWYHRLVHPFQVLYTGWVVYMSQEIVLAGLALSLLYLTVLGFDNITVGYGKEQGLSEGMIGIVMAAGALVGIGGTLLYPVLRNRLGLAKTGVFATILDVVCLAPCVVSIFVAGSPFQPDFLFDRSNVDDVVYNFSDATTLSTVNSTQSGDVINSYMSVGLLMGGITISRAALWMVDLTVTQLLLETPPEGQRGLVNGVQSSLNRLIDIFKFILVILLPWPETFGYLVIASYLAMIAAAVSYAAYGCKHWGKDIPTAKNDNNT